MYQPAFCVVAQGRKQALLGEEVFRYDPGYYLLFPCAPFSTVPSGITRV